ncbi:MAG: hypothetical protein CVU03_11360 [Bacteroidetes bacterium HGW-Bacteroidetes-2]|jgi:hypothetical protein|nr:MAG: hypothetical protein CVU03_11360 [Bacteroidetes bacterium HGW-Bacteroidetes-2]
MKTIVFGLLFLGITNLTKAQNEIAYVNLNATSIIEKPMKTMSNLNYLHSMELNVISNRVRALQTVVANFDIQKEVVYTKTSSATYDVVFREGKNAINAVFDSKGNIIQSDENYESVNVPYFLSKKILKEYPGWGYKQVWLSISYNQKFATTIQYKVVLKNGNKEKTISFNASDFI